MSVLHKISQLNKTANDTAAAVSATSIRVFQATIKNLSSEVVYIGDSAVTDSNGYALAQNAQLTVEMHENFEIDLADIFAVTNANTADVRISYVKRK